ncbi:MAG: hydrogenase 4 subunit F [Chloroflexi bacterium]|nr:MAG: hydrogenase 4 subunit F [Chloroflexota bacterium]
MLDAPWMSTIFVGVTLFFPLGLGIIGFVLLRFAGGPRVSRLMGLLTAVTSIILLILSILFITTPPENPIRFYIGQPYLSIYIDSLSLYFILIVNAIAFVATWNALPYLESEKPSNLFQHPTFFYASVNFFHFTMVLVPMMDNLIGLWIAIELTTLASAFLVGYTNTRNAWEAAWKYLIITSTGIIVAFLGTIFLVNAVPLTQTVDLQLLNWTHLVDLAKVDPHSWKTDFMQLSFIFIFVGYGTKAGLAPTHTWLPDGHGEAPAPISALLSGVLLKSALYAILRFYTITNIVMGDSRFTSIVMLTIGLFSLLLATPFIMKENRFKRILAYHSLEHMGIITFGIGIGGPIALAGALLHALNHAITKALMFLSYGNVLRQYRQAHPNATDFDETTITGVLRTMPITGTIMMIGGLALVGMPPFNIFMSEFIILWGALTQFNETMVIPGWRWIVITAVSLFLLSTALIFFGLVRHLSRLVLHKMEPEPTLQERPFQDLLPLFLLLGSVIVMGVWVIPALSTLITKSVDIVLTGGM